MSVTVTITVRTDDGVELTRSHTGGSSNSRFYAQHAVEHGERLLLVIARQLMQLAQLHGGAIFDSPEIAARVGEPIQRKL